MTDVPIDTPKADFPVEKSKAEQAAPDADQDASPSPADELAARFIMKLPEEDFKSLKVQKTFTEEARAATTEAQAESFKKQVVANMLQAAYNATWRTIQQRHGLPESLDINWNDGSAYRKSNES